MCVCVCLCVCVCDVCAVSLTVDQRTLTGWSPLTEQPLSTSSTTLDRCPNRYQICVGVKMCILCMLCVSVCAFCVPLTSPCTNIAYNYTYIQTVPNSIEVKLVTNCAIK